RRPLPQHLPRPGPRSALTPFLRWISPVYGLIHPENAHKEASTALRAHPRPRSGSSTARRRDQPVSGSPTSQRYQWRRRAAAPSWWGGTGHSSSNPVTAARAHQAANRPAAMPRRRPWAPPLAPVHAMAPSAWARSTSATRPRRAPRAATAPTAPPSTTAASARPLDSVTHAAARSTRARRASGSSTTGAGSASYGCQPDTAGGWPKSAFDALYSAVG